MNESTLHRRNFLLHLQERPGYDGPVLCKESAREPPLRSHAEQLHNEYAITCHLADVAGVRRALAKEGTESRPVLLLEYIKGQSLAELVRAATLDLAVKLRLAVNVARILGHVHDHQVVHKDISSSNIIVAGDDSAGSLDGIYIIDFGISLSAGEESPGLLAADDTLRGTLAYISPEQTGRINRRVDHRTDLYSLGVTLYELFTGQVPFGRGDPLELIHDHIARQAKPPHEVDPGIPGPVSDIVLKLLAKDPEDRYQTARGLRADLESCLNQWQDRGHIEPFGLGGDDITGHLRIPQRLYGRQTELQQLRRVLDRAVTEQAHLLLVAGYAGVGKTSLVRQFLAEVTEKQGVYIEGKFDQSQRILPYSGWRQAFTMMVNNWLGQSDTRIAGWRDTILDAVGDHGQVLIDLIPSLEGVLGPQPEVPQLAAVETRNRANYFFNRLLNCLATPEHPLVVFLDDLQWIDSASLELIEAVFAGPNASPLLIIGAYRGNEVGATHPLAISRDRMLAEPDRVTALDLEGLSPNAINRLLADSLQLGAADCRNLSHVLVEKSAGNPFFCRQLLFALEADGVLEFDRAQARWVWESNVRDHVQARGSAVDLMVETIQACSAATQRALSLAASIGSRFDLSTLQTINEDPRNQVRSALIPALRTGLIRRSAGRFSFAHDRVQEVAYDLIPASDRPTIHLRIGRSLLATANDEQLDGEIFAIVGHLNAGRTLIETESERIELAGLNMAAGQQAKAASAYADAKSYTEIGLELLGTGHWEDQYDLALSLHRENAELAYLTGQFEEVETTANLVHANARRILDRVRVYMTQIEAATARSRFAEGLDLGRRTLRDLGVDIPEQPSPGVGQRLHEGFVRLLTSQHMERLDELPRVSDERVMASSTLLASLMSTAYIAHPPLFPIISYQGASLTFEYGVDSWSPFFVGGVVLVTIASITPNTPADDARRMIDFGRRLVEVTRALVDNPITAGSRTKGLFMLAFASPWFESLEDSIELCRATYRSRNETGDWLYGAYGASLLSSQSLAAGTKLPRYQRELSACRDQMLKAGQVMNPISLAIHLQTAHSFMHSSPAPHRLEGAHFSEGEWLSQEAAADDLANRHYLSFSKLLLAYHFDRDEALDECVADAEAYLAAGPGLLTVVQFYFYQALARLRQIGDATATHDPAIRDLVENNVRWMSLWSETTPSTFQHKRDLIAAEEARVMNELERALLHYERAIDGARKSGCTHEEALANELYARFWADRGHDRFATALMREAHSLYIKWGAAAKAEHLTRRFPDLLAGRSIVDARPTPQSTSDLISSELDLRTVLKASQDIASKIDLDSLLAKLMSDVIQSTGAQRGYLLLESKGRWVIAARADVDDPESFSRATDDIAGTDLLAEGIVHYVSRKQETVVLDDAFRTGEFVDHEYVRATRARSILCAPLINQGKTSGIVYLENNLAPGVFTPQSVELLTVLSSQMAISIDNARTHAELRDLLEARSMALASAEAQIRTLFEDSPLGIALSNPEGRFLSVNKAVLEMLRIKGQLAEHGVTDFYDDPANGEALLRRVMESGGAQEFGLQVERLDGSRFHANLNVSRLDLQGNEVLLTMIQDVTGQITAEQETAALEERTRLARELHDAVSQTILSASLLADGTLRSAEEEGTVDTADVMRVGNLLHGALDEMRTLLLEMRPTAVRNRTLGQLLAPLVEAARARTSSEVNLRIEGDRVLPSKVTQHLQRIVQESLNNALRHAEAETVRIDLICDPDGVLLRIADNGRGFDVESPTDGHHGLDIMGERAEEIGAVLEIQSTIGEGTVVSVTWS